VLGPEDLDIPDGRSFDTSESAHLEPEDDDDSEDEKVNGGAEGREVRSSSEARSSGARSVPKETLSRHRRDERERIISALEACNWNRVAAAKLSGIPRRTFYRRLREYGIQ
jgi:transcriptional regulator of acetoin/glycerol metabolism